jgi:hypothetical protein
VAVGLNVTLIVQLDFAARVEGLIGQVVAGGTGVVRAKSTAFTPVIVMLLIVNATPPVLDSVTG